MTREEQIRLEIDYQLAGSFGNYPEGYEEGFIESRGRTIIHAIHLNGHGT